MMLKASVNFSSTSPRGFIEDENDDKDDNDFIRGKNVHDFSLKPLI